MNRLEMTMGWTMALWLTACGSEADPDATDTTEMVTWTGTATAAPFQVSVGGAEICADDPAIGCTTADEDGSYELQLPANRRVIITVSAPDHVSALTALTVGDSDEESLYAPLMPRAMAEAQASDLDVAIDPNHGHISFLVWDEESQSGVPGASASLSPASGRGPFYTDAGELSPTGTETTGWGGGFILAVPPGEYGLSLAGADCGSPKYDNDGAGTYSLPVRADVISHAICLAH